MPRIALIQLNIPKASAICTLHAKLQRTRPILLQAAAEQAVLVVILEMTLGMVPRKTDKTEAFARDMCRQSWQISNL